MNDHLSFRGVIVLVAVCWCAQAWSQVSIPAAYRKVMAGGGNQMYLESIYLPPVTTGPWAPAWSPDGRELVFAMQGSLWKLPAAGGAAVQLATGQFYDSEPAWSPDGQQIVFTRDTGSMIDIWIAEADGSNPRQLTPGDGAVNVNPQWLPGGRQLVYSSTQNSDSFNLRVLSVASASPSEPLLQDEYQNLEPSSSPDGKQIVFLSNRDLRRRWDDFGSGDVWKLSLTDKHLTLLLQEETQFHTRPKWSPDGAKIAYVSHRSGSNQLWVMHPETGFGFQITHDSGEVFTPAWSPDSRWIAYISNANERFTLWKVPAVGGEPEELRITEFKYRQPTGGLKVVVRDAATGDSTPARVYLKVSDGKAYAPRGAFHRVVSLTGDHYFHTPGTFTVDLPAGPVSLWIMKGFEYRPEQRQVEIVAGKDAAVDIPLTRLLDLAARGWYSGDTHLHMNYTGIFGATPHSLLLEAQGEDLNVTNSLIANKNAGRLLDFKYFEGKPNAASDSRYVLYFGQEYRPNFAGHMGLLNLKEYVFPSFTGYQGTAYSADYPSNSQVLDAVHAQGAVGGYVHPGKRGELPVSVALGKVDFYDLMCVWTDEYTVADAWYRLLNLGFKVPIAAGTDVFPNYWRSPVIGSVRVYVQTGPVFQYGEWVKNLTTGRAFVTNGPLLFFQVNEQEPGAELTLPASDGISVRVKATAVSIFPMQTLDIVHNGKVVRSLTPSDPYKAELEMTLPVDGSGWVAARVTGPEKVPLLMDNYVFAHSAPVYLRKHGSPPRSPVERQ